MSNDQAARTGLAGLLWLLEQMMRSIDERFAPPSPSGVLARLCRALPGKALADEAARAMCALLRVSLAVSASSLSASLAVDLPSPATQGGPHQDAALPRPPSQPEASSPEDAGGLEGGAPPLACDLVGDGPSASIATDLATCAADAASMADASAARAAMCAAACHTLGGDAAQLPASDAGKGALATHPSDADKVAARLPAEDAPALDAEAGVRTASRSDARFEVDHGDDQARTSTPRAHPATLMEFGLTVDAPGGRATGALPRRTVSGRVSVRSCRIDRWRSGVRRSVRCQVGQAGAVCGSRIVHVRGCARRWGGAGGRAPIWFPCSDAIVEVATNSHRQWR